MDEDDSVIARRVSRGPQFGGGPTVTAMDTVSRAILAQGPIMGFLRRLRLGRSRLNTIILSIFLIALFALIVSYFSGDSQLSTAPKEEKILELFKIKEQRRKNWNRFRADDNEAPMQMCKVPKLSLKNDANIFAFHKMPPLVCGSGDLMYLKDGALYVNYTLLGSRKLSRCEYRSISWVTDSIYTYSDPLIRKAPEPFEIIINHDFVHVECYLEKKSGLNKQGEHYPQRRLLQDDNGMVATGNRVIQRRINYPLEGIRRMEAQAQRASQQGLRDKVPEQLSEDLHHNEKPDPNSSRYKKEENIDLTGKVQEHNHQVQNLVQAQGKHPILKQNQQIPKILQRGDNVWHNSPHYLGSMGLPDPPYFRGASQQQQAKNQDTNINSKYPPKSLKSNGGGNELQGRIQGNQLTNQAYEITREKDQFKVQQNRRNDLERSKEQRKEDGRVDADDDTYKDYTFNPSAYEYNVEYPDFDQFVAQIVPKQDVLKRISELPPQHRSSERMNIFIFALDSMSHLTYQRKLPKTYAYLKNRLGAIILNSYNIVGDATTAAIIPLTTGHTELELPEVRKDKPGSTYVDVYPFIWNLFEQQGYITLFTEDKPDIGTFNMRFNGFEEIPTDHYMRPFYQAVLDSSLQDVSPKFCLGSRPAHAYMLDYLADFFKKYPEHIPKFVFAFLSDLSHNDNNPVEYLDDDMVKFLTRLEQSNYLNNTLLIVMGDHGARYSAVRFTTQGKLEERMPMMSLTFPQWFQKKFPDLMRKLYRNADRLTTPFDIHETLKTVLDLSSVVKPVKKSDRGISLLKNIPMNRTCASAGIDLHWCSCMNWQDISIESSYIQRAATVLTEHLNSLTEKHRSDCAPLQLKAINDAKIGLPNERVLKYLRSIDGDQRVANFSEEIKTDIFYLQLVVETTPGNGLFEATITMIAEGKSYRVAQGISRINAYGKQPHCIMDKFPDLRKFCYCRLQWQKPSVQDSGRRRKG